MKWIMKSKNRFLDFPNFIFDCDGVILDSNRIKNDVFTEVARNFSSPSQTQQFILFHEENGGINRIDKFNYLFKNILGLHKFDIELEEALNLFKLISLKLLVKAETIPGLVDFIQKCDKKEKFVISAGHQEDLEFILKAKNLDKYFTSLHGGPKTKISHIQDLNIRGPCVLFGDSDVDLKAATHFNYDFVMIHGATNWKEWKSECDKKTLPYFRDFRDLL